MNHYRYVTGCVGCCSSGASCLRDAAGGRTLATGHARDGWDRLFEKEVIH
jgi:hypothetical protein